MTARQLAVSALLKCRKSGAWSGNVLDSLIKREKQLDERDKNLAYNICLGVIQNSSLIDFYINSFSSKAVDKLDPEIAEILRAGVYQLLFLDKIPPSAAVNESVELCSFFGCAKAKGFVNAVLRKAGNKSALPSLGTADTADYLALKYSHPHWFAEYIVKLYGYEFCESFFAENNKKAPIDLRINTLKLNADAFKNQLLSAGVDFSIPEFPSGCVTIEGGNVAALPGYSEGNFFVQDRAASTVAEIADLTPGMKVLDCCSAPGGKTFSAAMKMQNKGSITSCDIHEKKLGLISSGANRLGIDIVSVRCMDASAEEPEYISAFDTIIADVPCSGMGVIRKKPEIRYKTAEEISRLPDIQLKIIQNVSKYVKTGGELLYSTCTVIREENENIVKAFLNSNPEFTAVPFEYHGNLCDDGMLTFWPNVHGTDGFFVAKLKRIK